MIAEHFVGLSVVNTNHPEAPFIFFKAVDSILVTLERCVRNEQEWPPEYDSAPSV